MPDISMCEDKHCPRRTKCYRFTATPNPYRQSYFAGSPRNPDGTCDHYIKAEVVRMKKPNQDAWKDYKK